MYFIKRNKRSFRFRKKYKTIKKQGKKKINKIDKYTKNKNNFKIKKNKNNRKYII